MKALRHVEKLLRLASSSSGASDPERASAALEVVRLITEHDFTVCPREPPRHQTQKTQKPPRRAYPSAAQPAWHKSTSAQVTTCSSVECGVVIPRGAVIWRRVDGFRVEYVCVDCIRHYD